MKEKTKKCYKCGRTLPITEFYKNRYMKDGLQTICKECVKKRDEERKTKRLGELKDIGLSAYTPRDLMHELAKRGYYGSVCFDQKKEREVEIDGQKGVFSYTETVTIDITNF